MENTQPSDFVPPFTNERLAIISNALLEQCYETDDDLQSSYDSNYSLGCTRFDRQKNRLLDMPLVYSWLTVTDSSNRLIMSIDGAPFRFTNDNPIVPKKKSSSLVSKTESKQMSNFTNGQFQLRLIKSEDPSSENELNIPIKWRFYIDVIQSSELDSKEYEVFFVGLNVIDEPCCIWKHTENVVPHITSIDENITKKVETSRAKITLPNRKDTKVNNE